MAQPVTADVVARLEAAVREPAMPGIALAITCGCCARSQIVIDIAGELAARRGDRFEDYTEGVRSLSRDARFPAELVAQLGRLPGFRNILVHEYLELDLRRVVEALDGLEPVERFLEIVRDLERPV